MIFDNLQISHDTKMPIMCTTHAKKHLYTELAKKFNISIPEPLVISDYSYLRRDLSSLGDTTFFVDDPETFIDYVVETPMFISRYLGKPYIKKQLTKSEALDLLGFDPMEYEIIDDKKDNQWL